MIQSGCDAARPGRRIYISGSASRLNFTRCYSKDGQLRSTSAHVPFAAKIAIKHRDLN